MVNQCSFLIHLNIHCVANAIESNCQLVISCVLLVNPVHNPSIFMKLYSAHKQNRCRILSCHVNLT